MPATPTFRAQGYARALYDRLTIVEHYEAELRAAEAKRTLEDAELWLRLVADALGFDIVKQTNPRTADPLDNFVARINAMALGVKP